MKIYFKKTSTKAKRILSFFLVFLCCISFTPAKSSAAATGYTARNTIDDSELTSPYTSQNRFGGTSACSIAFDFHIFAEEVTLNAHTNGNIATNTLHAQNQAFGARTGNYLNKREDNYIGKHADGISNIGSNGYTIIGNQVYSETNSNDRRVTIGENCSPLSQDTSKNVYKESTESSPYIDIASELQHLADISTSFSKKQTSADVTLSDPDNDQQSLCVTSSGGNHYLSVSAGELCGSGKRILHISLPADTTLVINVDMSGASADALANLVVNLNQFANGESVIEHYCGLVWNLYDSSSSDGLFHSEQYACVGTSDYFFGTILAPAASIQYGAVNGSVIAKKAYQDGKESHRFDFSGYEEPDEPTTEQPTSEQPTSEQPTSEQPTSEQPTSEQPTSEQPTSEQPTSEQPTSEQPTSEQPTSEQPTSEQPTSEQPTSEQPTSEQPTSEQPTSEQPTSEQPTSEQPTSEQPTSEQPTSEQPTSEQPTSESVSTKKNDTNTVIHAQSYQSSQPKTEDATNPLPLALLGMTSFGIFVTLGISLYHQRKSDL